MAATQRMHMLFLGVTKHLMAHVDHLFGKFFWIFEHFAESYQSTSNLAKISLLNGVPLLVLQKLSQYQPPVGNLLNTLPFHACRWFILDYKKISSTILTKQNSKHFDRSLFFGSSSFCLSFWKMFLIWTLLMITVDYFYPLVFAMGCQQKKYQIPLTQKREKRGKAAFFKDTSNYFSLLNLKSLIERYGSLRNLWEGEREKFIKYIKAEINTICDTKTFMYGVLNKLLHMHCLENFMKNNQYYKDT